MRFVQSKKKRRVSRSLHLGCEMSVAVGCDEQVILILPALLKLPAMTFAPNAKDQQKANKQEATFEAGWEWWSQQSVEWLQLFSGWRGSSHWAARGHFLMAQRVLNASQTQYSWRISSLKNCFWGRRCPLHGLQRLLCRPETRAANPNAIDSSHGYGICTRPKLKTFEAFESNFTSFLQVQNPIKMKKEWDDIVQRLGTATLPADAILYNLMEALNEQFYIILHMEYMIR